MIYRIPILLLYTLLFGLCLNHCTTTADEPLASQAPLLQGDDSQTAGAEEETKQSSPERKWIEIGGGLSFKVSAGKSRILEFVYALNIGSTQDFLAIHWNVYDGTLSPPDIYLNDKKIAGEGRSKSSGRTAYIYLDPDREKWVELQDPLNLESIYRLMDRGTFLRRILTHWAGVQGEKRAMAARAQLAYFGMVAHELRTRGLWLDVKYHASQGLFFLSAKVKDRVYYHYLDGKIPEYPEIEKHIADANQTFYSAEKSAGIERAPSPTVDKWRNLCYAPNDDEVAALEKIEELKASLIAAAKESKAPADAGNQLFFACHKFHNNRKVREAFKRNCTNQILNLCQWAPP